MALTGDLTIEKTICKIIHFDKVADAEDEAEDEKADLEEAAEEAGEGEEAEAETMEAEEGNIQIQNFLSFGFSICFTVFLED